jgi:hypothetical protein
MCKFYVSLRQTARKTEASSRAEIMSVGVGRPLCLYESRQPKKYGLGVCVVGVSEFSYSKGGKAGGIYTFGVTVGGITDVPISKRRVQSKAVLIYIEKVSCLKRTSKSY